MKTLLSLVVWFVLWEIAGRLKISTIVPPFSAVVEAAFEIAPTDTLTYVAVGAGLLLVSLVASWIPARRAARVDPVAALRNLDVVFDRLEKVEVREG